MSDFQIHPATRQGIKPLIGVYGRSGSGKTLSALKLARGLVGPTGRIILCDSESGRGSLFCDIVPGGYRVIDIEPPFSPERYEAAIVTAEGEADCVVVDSLTHEHCGEGGVLDMQEAELNRMAGNDWKKRDQWKMASWIKPKLAHKKFIQRLLRLKCGLICCLRGEQKTHMVKDGAVQFRPKGEEDPFLYPPREKAGKSKVITDEFSTPLFDPRFIFELLLNLETVAQNGEGGYVIPRKITHPSIAPLLPKSNEQVSIQHGELLAKWCAAPGTTPTVEKPADLKSLKSKLWKITQEQHHGSAQGLEQWLWDEGILSDTESLTDLPVGRLAQVVDKVEFRLNNPPVP